MYHLELVREYRLKLALTQTELSRLSGVSLPFIQNIESKRANPSIRTLEALFSSLGLKWKIGVSDPDWDYLAWCGVPLQASVSSPSHFTFDSGKFSRALKHAAFYLSENNDFHREIDAIQATLIGIREHYPKFFNRHLKQLEKWIPKIPNGRLIKLRRIAIAGIGRML
jgi:transcriptional regulator with XRE-family HTH domain